METSYRRDALPSASSLPRRQQCTQVVCVFSQNLLILLFLCRSLALAQFLPTEPRLGWLRLNIAAVAQEGEGFVKMEATLRAMTELPVPSPSPKSETGIPDRLDLYTAFH